MIDMVVIHLFEPLLNNLIHSGFKSEKK